MLPLLAVLLRGIARRELRVMTISRPRSAGAAAPT